MAINSKATIQNLDSVSGSAKADGAGTVELRFTFPFDKASITSVYVGSIGVKNTGTVKVEKGMQAGGTNLLSGASFDVNTLAANNVLESIGLTATATDLVGVSLDVITVSFINCVAAHFIKIEFEKAKETY